MIYFKVELLHDNEKNSLFNTYAQLLAADAKKALHKFNLESASSRIMVTIQANESYPTYTIDGGDTNERNLIHQLFQSLAPTIRKQ